MIGLLRGWSNEFDAAVWAAGFLLYWVDYFRLTM